MSRNLEAENLDVATEMGCGGARHLRRDPELGAHGGGRCVGAWPRPQCSPLRNQGDDSTVACRLHPTGVSGADEEGRVSTCVYHATSPPPPDSF